jgi:hypothetical protein
MQAITLPTDADRRDVLDAIESIPSLPRKMSCFLDYLIDYTANLNLILEQAQDELAEVKNQRSVLKAKSHQTRSRSLSSADYARSLELLGVESGSLFGAIQDLIAENKRLREASPLDRAHSDIDDLKQQFADMENDIQISRKEVRRRKCAARNE